MKKFFRFVGIAACVGGAMIVGGIADRRSKTFSAGVDRAENGMKRVKRWATGVIQPKNQ